MLNNDDFNLVTAAATTATTTPAAASTAVTTPASTALFARPGLVDRQRPAVMFFVVQTLDGRLGLLVGSHFDEGKTLASSRVAILNDLSADHVAELSKQLLQGVVGRSVTQITDIQPLSHLKSPQSGQAISPASTFRGTYERGRLDGPTGRKCERTNAPPVHKRPSLRAFDRRTNRLEYTDFSPNDTTGVEPRNGRSWRPRRGFTGLPWAVLAITLETSAVSIGKKTGAKICSS